MWCVLCLLAFLAPREVWGSLAEEMSRATEICCNQGTSYARNHTSDDCTSSIPPDVQFGSLCLFAMDGCCKEYFAKKQSCDDGIATATSTKRCNGLKNTERTCCVECLRGRASSTGCENQVNGKAPEDLLAGDAFVECCQTSQRSDEKTRKPKFAVTFLKKTKETHPDMASMCEDYAPTELCAHHCIPTPGSYKCECNPGFRLMADGRNCMEIFNNRCKTHNPCQHKCNDNGKVVKCSCKRGYELLPDKKSCKDIDECTLNPSICRIGTTCSNVPGSHKCIPNRNQPINSDKPCPPGFKRNDLNNACDDVNECKLFNPPCPAYLCENTVGGYKCGGKSGDPQYLNNKPPPSLPADDRCPPGFTAGKNEECEDVDECLEQKNDCNLLSQFCINTRGSFHCQDKASKHCPPGFVVNVRSGKCEDFNECDDGQDVCRPDQICVNVPGEYDCKPKVDFSRKQNKCPEGFRMLPGTTKCEDIDECAEGTHLCGMSQTCSNTNGSHQCDCKIGYEQDPTTGACVDLNECATDKHNCLDDSQRCDNTQGSFICVRITSCGTGYILHHTSGKCEDIDECVVGTHNCGRAGPQFKCMNTHGSFRCVLKQSPSTTTTTESEYEYYYDSVEEEDSKNDTTNSVNQEVKPTEPKIPETKEPDITEIPSNPTNPEENQQAKPKVEVEIPDNKISDNMEDNINNIDESYNVLPKMPENTVTEKVEEPTLIFITTTEKVLPVTIPTPSEKDENEVSPNLFIPEGPFPIETEPKSSEKYDITGNFTPGLVYVSVGPETATVNATKNQDGSIVFHTKDVPKNEWTKVKATTLKCDFGFEDVQGVCMDIDECVTNKHTCSGLTEMCHNTLGGYICFCKSGFSRDLLTGACVIIISSTSTTTEPSSTTSFYNNYYTFPGQRLPSRPFRGRTQCDAGHNLNYKTGRCEDIDECQNGIASCAAVEICVNTIGGYKCDCPPNWTLDPVRYRCVPLSSLQTNNSFINEPYPYTPGRDEYHEPKTVDIQEVRPTYTNFEAARNAAKCPKGYLPSNDGSCEDTDECANGEAKCGFLQICTNLPGGYTCSCPSGFKQVGDHQCQDVDECLLAGNEPICSEKSDCVNTVGSYQCRCHKGFRNAAKNDNVCVDIDECAESRSGSLCQHRCMNVWGGYKCACHKGYRINSDNSTCSDIDECTQYKSNVPCVGRCVNEPGSFHCSCPTGYRLSEDKRSCIDIDECETGEATCAKNAPRSGTVTDVCLNTRGAYKCYKINCPLGYRLENKHRCTKTGKVCDVGDWECAHQPTTYSYNFITFVSKLYIPQSKVDLFTMRGPQWAQAQTQFQLNLVDVNAPPTTKKADITSFKLNQTTNQAVVSLVESLEGPQSIELELSMKLYNREQFAGIAVAKLFIQVSEYEF